MSQRSLRLTNSQILSTQLDAIIAQKPIILWCKQLRGFALRISPPNKKYPHGKTSYLVQKHQAGRKSREIRFTFGTYPEIPLVDAYNQAISLLAQIRNNQNPSAERKSVFSQRKQLYLASKTNKFSIVCEQYRKKRLEEPNSNTNYFNKELPYLFNKHVYPSIGNKSLTEIHKDDLRTLLKAIPTIPMRGKIHAMMLPLFKYALQEDIITTNPFEGIAPTPKPKSRDRYLDKTEISALWKSSLDTIDTDRPMFGYFYQVLLLTALRLREASNLEISELDIPNKQLIIPANRMKMDQAHVVPLTDFTIAQINKIPRKHKIYIFSYGRAPLSGFSAAKSLLDQGMQKYLPAPLKPFVNHSLRATFSSHLGSLGINGDIIDRCLAHAPKSTSGSMKPYQLYEFMPERRYAMNTWSEFVEALIQ